MAKFARVPAPGTDAPGARPLSTRIVLGVSALLLVALLATVLVRALGPRPVPASAFEAMLRSGELAGVATALTADPAKPQLDLDQLRGAYQDTESCTTYWRSAAAHLLSQASAVATDPQGSGVQEVSAELWDDAGAASDAVAAWTTCLGDFGERSAASYPVELARSGESSGVAWRYAQSLDLNNPVHLLTLRARNLVASFSLPDAPASEWVDELAGRFHTQVEAAAAKG